MDGERKRKVRRIEEREVGKESKKGSVEGGRGEICGLSKKSRYTGDVMARGGVRGEASVKSYS